MQLFRAIECFKCDLCPIGAMAERCYTSFIVGVFQRIQDASINRRLWYPAACQMTRSQVMDYKPGWNGNRMMTSSNGNIFRVTGPLCGEFTGSSEFPAQRPVTRRSDVFFDLRQNKRLSKQP